MAHLTTPEILDAGLDDWRKLAQALHARFRIADFPAGAAFVNAVADAAEAANHHPDVTLAYGRVDVVLTTHEEGHSVTAADVDLARTISGIAREHGLVPDPGVVAQVELGLDTASQERVAGFWSALLTGAPGHVVGDSVLDPQGQAPNVWFQRTEEHDEHAQADEQEPRQRWHLDVWVAPEVAQARIDAAVAAGGEVVDDSQAPSFTVLADPDGNKACVCTALDRP